MLATSCHDEQCDYAGDLMTPVSIGLSRRANIILVIHAAILLLLTVAGPLYYYGGFSAGAIFHPACIALLVLMIWWYWSWIAFSHGGGLDPYILFLSAAVLFNCGQPILEVFGLNEDGLLHDHFSEEISLASLYLIAVGISALHFGVLSSTALSSYRGRGRQRTHQFPFSEIHSRNVYRVGVTLFLLAAIPSLLNLRERLQMVMAAGYGSLYEERGATGLAASTNILSDFIISGAALIIAGGRRKPIMRVVALSWILGWSGVEVFLGGRAHALMPTLGMVWLWDRAVQPVSRTVLIGVALFMIVVVFPLVAVTRQEAGSDRLSLGHLQKAFSNIDNPMVTELSEMGSSANTIAWTLELVPRVRPFSLGGTYLSAALTLFPNLTFSEPHPALRLFGYDIPDFWVTWEIDRAFAQRGGSYGFSFIAEAYLNFGWAAPICLFMLGLIYGRVRGWTLEGNDPARMAIMGIFLASILFFARGSMLFLIRPLCWYALFPYLAILVLDSWCARGRHHSNRPGIRAPFDKEPVSLTKD
jgi:oligosaccharide repeat unit polymerase